KGINNDHWASAHKYASSGFLSGTTTTTRDSQSDTYAAASTISGDRVALKAGHDLHITASNVAADNDLTAIAGHDMTIDAAANHHRENHYEKTMTNGLFTSNGSLVIGQEATTNDKDAKGLTHTGTAIGSVNGDVTLIAGRNYAQTASDLISGGDIRINA